MLIKVNVRRLAAGLFLSLSSMNRLLTALMILTIGTIVAFQGYWLRRNYLEEKKLLNSRANLLFKETVFKLQAARLHLDTAMKLRIRADDEGGAVNVAGIAQRETASVRAVKEFKSIILMRRDSTPSKDTISPPKNIFYRSKGTTTMEIILNLDSIKDISAKEVSDRLQQRLIQEGIHSTFRITVSPAPPGGGPHRDVLGVDAEPNKAMVGFKHPSVYQLQFDDPTWFLLRRISLQLLFSLVLVGVTVLSFLLLYRNWRQQRKLTLLKNDFISNITHELKTPIATVSVAVEAMRNFNALEDPVRTQEYLDISANELQRLSLLVDKVLKLSLFERQEIELKKDHFDLKKLTEEVMASMRLQFEKYKAALTIGTEGTDFNLRADKLHITSVIFNLLDNALKYSKASPAIRVDLGEEEDQLVLSVTDNGIGIPTAYKDRIFEKFFRVPTGDQHNVKGYGLGLSYVAYVVQRQGGAISVDSRLGEGSRFTVKIPRNHV